MKYIMAMSLWHHRQVGYGKGEKGKDTMKDGVVMIIGQCRMLIIIHLGKLPFLATVTGAIYDSDRILQWVDEMVS